MKLSRIISFVFAFVVSVSLAFGQSQGDALYNQGLQLQKDMTIKSQNAAISKFNAAKKLYDSAAKKSQCDHAISVSRNIISSLKGGGDGKVKKDRKDKGKTNTTQQSAPVAVTPRLDLSNSSFDFDLGGKTVSVSVNTNQDSWSVAPVANADGSSFLTVNKTGANTFDIVVPMNQSFETRTQTVRVTAGDLSKDVSVSQTGRHVTLTAKDQTIKFKEKGGDKKIEISCNSDHQYETNSNENWYVESQPNWVIITVNEKREKGFFAKLKDKGEELVMGKSKNQDDTLVKSSITVTCNHLQPGTAEAFTGRQGDIILRSGDSTVKIHVTQLGKDSTVK